ncbi:hypothetical protein Hamer_G031162, partial [Homarus americanus]
MLEEDEEQQPTQEDDVKPGEPTTRQLTKPGDDDGTTDDDLEVLGDLLVEELPQDFEGFDAEVRGGSREEAETSSPALEPINHFTDSI